MLKVKDMPRRSGKTSSVITIMEYDSEVYCIVPNKGMIKDYPEHLRSRILNGSEDLRLHILGKKISNVVLDEGFLYNKLKLAEIYYELGFYRINVVSYVTLEDSN